MSIPFDPFVGLPTCAKQYIKRLDNGTELVLTCQRKWGHEGLHTVLWMNGYLEWGEVPSKPERAGAVGP